MNNQDLKPIWLWRVKVVTSKSGKEKLVSKVGPNGQLIKVPEQEMILMNSELSFDIRQIVEYHEINDEKDKTAVLVRDVGALKVRLKFDEFDNELRRRLNLIEDSNYQKKKMDEAYQ